MQTRSFADSLRYAVAGVSSAIHNERNVRIHVFVALVVVGLGCVLNVSRVDWAILVIAIGGVISAEIINTALEALVDLVSPDYHELAKTAKDAGAGAVLVVCASSIVVGLLILGPPLLERLKV